jgi:hypothetical protein
LNSSNQLEFAKEVPYFARSKGSSPFAAKPNYEHKRTLIFQGSSSGFLPETVSGQRN